METLQAAEVSSPIPLSGDRYHIAVAAVTGTDVMYDQHMAEVTRDLGQLGMANLIQRLESSSREIQDELSGRRTDEVSTASSMPDLDPPLPTGRVKRVYGLIVLH